METGKRRISSAPTRASNRAAVLAVVVVSEEPVVRAGLEEPAVQVAQAALAEPAA
jgi:hypothetical protein